MLNSGQIRKNETVTKTNQVTIGKYITKQASSKDRLVTSKIDLEGKLKNE